MRMTEQEVTERARELIAALDKYNTGQRAGRQRYPELYANAPPPEEGKAVMDFEFELELADDADENVRTFIAYVRERFGLDSQVVRPFVLVQVECENSDTDTQDKVEELVSHFGGVFIGLYRE
jgi:hypothetical protein